MKKAVAVAALLSLSACSYGYREDVDQIGSIRRTHTLGWKEGPREEAYRPARNNNYYYQAAPSQGDGRREEDCVPAAPAAEGGWKPWMK